MCGPLSFWLDIINVFTLTFSVDHRSGTLLYDHCQLLVSIAVCETGFLCRTPPVDVVLCANYVSYLLKHTLCLFRRVQRMSTVFF